MFKFLLKKSNKEKYQQNIICRSKFTGEKATVVVDSKTNKLITVWQTSDITLKRLKGELVKNTDSILRIELSLEQYNMLKEVLNLPQKIISNLGFIDDNIDYDSLKTKLEIFEEDNKYFVCGNVYNIDELRIVIGDYLIFCGFNDNENYEPNKKGKILEDLVDLLYDEIEKDK